MKKKFTGLRRPLSAFLAVLLTVGLTFEGGGTAFASEERCGVEETTPENTGEIIMPDESAGNDIVEDEFIEEEKPEDDMTGDIIEDPGNIVPDEEPDIDNPADDLPLDDITPPAVEPPAEEPPVETPPAEEPPVEDPPDEDPPIEEPPVETPPAEEPPIEEPPAEVPPIEQPPAEEATPTPEEKPPVALFGITMTAPAVASTGQFIYEYKLTYPAGFDSLLFPEGLFVLSPGESRSVSGVPDGTTYTVFLTMPEGFVTDRTSWSGTVTAGGVSICPNVSAVKTTYTAYGSGVSVTARVSSNSGLPFGTELHVTKLSESSYISAVRSWAGMKNVRFAPYDIYFTCGGSRVQPSGTVSISMSFSGSPFGNTPYTEMSVLQVSGGRVFRPSAGYVSSSGLSVFTGSLSVIGPMIVTKEKKENDKEKDKDKSKETSPDSEKDREKLPVPGKTVVRTAIEQLNVLKMDKTGAAVDYYKDGKVPGLVREEGWRLDFDYAKGTKAGGDEGLILKYQMRFLTNKDIPQNGVMIKVPIALYGELLPDEIAVPEAEDMEHFEKSGKTSFNYYVDPAEEEDEVDSLVFFNYEEIKAGTDTAWQVLYKDEEPVYGEWNLRALVYTDPENEDAEPEEVPLSAGRTDRQARYGWEKIKKKDASTRTENDEEIENETEEELVNEVQVGSKGPGTEGQATEEPGMDGQDDLTGEDPDTKEAAAAGLEDEESEATEQNNPAAEEFGTAEQDESAGEGSGTEKAAAVEPKVEAIMMPEDSEVEVMGVSEGAVTENQETEASSSEPKKEPEKELDEETDRHPHDSDGVSITIEADSESGLPDDVMLVVKTPDTEQYEEIMTSTREELGELQFIPYDVSLMESETKLQPLSPIRVTMVFDQNMFEQNGKIVALHIKEDGLIEKIEPESVTEKEIVFVVDSFSIMGPALLSSQS